MREFIFKSSGVAVRVRPVAPLLGQRVVASIPPPEPPMVTVEYEPGKPVQEPNPAAPSHMAALARHSQLLNERILDACILFGVANDLSVEALGQVGAMRRDLAALGLAQPDEDDRLIYVKFIAMLRPEEGGEFVAFVLGAPSEAAIERHAAAFRSDVSGS